MKKALPFTPAEVLDLSTPFYRFKLFAYIMTMRLMGKWRKSDPNTATCFEEMTFKDICYWVHKCTSPIKKPERKSVLEHLSNRDLSKIHLPKGFGGTSSVTFGALGDILQADGLDYAKDMLYEQVHHLVFDQTISYANFESPITDGQLIKEAIGNKEAPIECCSPAQFDALASHRGKYFSVLNSANNHTFDRGLEGIAKTQGTFRDKGILDVGTNLLAEQQGKGRFLTYNDVKIGFVSVTFGLNGHQLPKGNEYLVNVAQIASRFAPVDFTSLKQQIKDCEEQACDFIIATMHWGYEFEFFPRNKQIDAARQLVEMGADAVISHHPHVIQPIEYYKTLRDPHRLAVIAYSLGSVTWGFTAPHIVLSLILNMKITKGIIDGKQKTYIEKAMATPIFRSCLLEKGRILTRLEKLADFLDNPHHAHNPQYIKQIKRYADLVLGAKDYNEQWKETDYPRADSSQKVAA